MSDSDLDRQAVEEMTTFLRDGSHFQGLAAALREKGFDPNQILLADFMENEDGKEWGALLTEDGTIYQFERDAYPAGSANLDAFRLRQLPRDAAIAVHPEVAAAVEMLEAGERVTG